MDHHIPQTLTVLWLKSAYEDGRVTPEDVVEEIIRRAEADESLHLWVTPPSMAGIRPYLDRLNELDPANAPLWGIPFAIKDNIDLAGVPTTAGCAAYAYVPAESASVVRRMLEAGAIPVGKANLDQFATGLVGTRSPFGETSNALRPELISGGSSSGSAVSVARGQVAFAFGTDTAGSGRVPAALNGLIGWKPSFGAWPSKGMVPACATLDCITVFANELEDALAVDRIARGYESSDPWSKPFGTIVPRIPAKLLLPKEKLVFYGPFADDYEKAWERTMQEAERLGIPTTYIDTGFLREAADILYEGPWVAERWAALGEFVEAHPGAAFPVTETILRSGLKPQFDAASVFRALHKLQAFKRQAQELLQDAVLLLPTCGGTWTRDEVRRDPIGTNRDMGRYTNHCNLLDLCAVAFPAGEAAERLPFGVTAFALADDEGLLAGIAARFAGKATIEEAGG